MEFGIAQPQLVLVFLEFWDCHRYSKIVFNWKLSFLCCFLFFVIDVILIFEGVFVRHVNICQPGTLVPKSKNMS